MRDLAARLPGDARQCALIRLEAVAQAEPEPPAEPEPVAEPASPLASERDKIDLLRELGELHTSGVLTDGEFEQQKARILGS